MTEEKKTELFQLAQDNFKLWNQALLSKDPEVVAKLYAEDASFLPTLNGELKKGQSGAQAYFEHFLLKNPEGKIVEAEVRETSRDANGEVDGFLHSGLYDFEVGSSEARQIVPARFTFLWQKDTDGNWKIAHHHSSLKP